MRTLLVSLMILLSLPAICQIVPTSAITTIDRKEKYLDSIVKMIGDKRIVAIGEDTHGTGDFYDLRAAITQRLLREKGFNMVILENPHEDMLAMQEKLSTENLDTLMRQHLFEIYQSKEMRNFLFWFRKQAIKQKNLRLAGCDDSYRDILPRYIQRAAAPYNNKGLNNLCVQLLEQTKEGTPQTPAQFVINSHVLRQMDSICIAGNYNDARLKEYIYHAQSGYEYEMRTLKKIVTSRDEIMGERINFHAADPSAKIIVWAHSAHIARYAWLMKEVGMMGATIVKRNPNDYYSIGLSGGTGTYSYINTRFINVDHTFKDSLLHANLYPIEANSWNQTFNDAQPAAYLIDFAKLSAADRAEWAKPRPIKMLGYNKATKTGNYYPVTLPNMFDALIFLKETRHTTALF
ncbi:erythromycin esterase family protein [Paraflavitalea pollutisoli]|uniref:erythromycin esterase family protein n=1 Tax=Paraflavitalea pollutisoli TaxID=3034143 RepID=UPI0023EBDB1A|nr:erythromycin esterase family protein [Paraflavitalea sp. H1-2-19X]